jgi:2-hydroxy-6-oxonona-2,4-dienedioate hydrolase
LQGQGLFTIVNGFKTRYREFGRATEKEHVLFIHGLGSSSDRWRDIPEALSKYFHTIAVDLVGFGGSDTPRNFDYTINNLMNHIVEFMGRVGVADGKTSIIGHSLGGYIASEITIEHRDLINNLVLIDSSGMLNAPTPLLEQYLQAAMYPSYDNVRSVFKQMVADPTLVLPILIDHFIIRINLPNAKYSFRSAFENSTRNQVGLSRLGTIDTVPTLLIWGKKDRVIPVEYLEPFKVIKNSRVEIVEDSGHAPFSEKPALVCEILHEFLT